MLFPGVDGSKWVVFIRCKTCGEQWDIRDYKPVRKAYSHSGQKYEEPPFERHFNILAGHVREEVLEDVN